MLDVELLCGWHQQIATSVCVCMRESEREVMILNYTLMKI